MRAIVAVVRELGIAWTVGLGAKTASFLRAVSIKFGYYIDPPSGGVVYSM